MTVVAYDGRFIAVDSRISQGSHISDDDYNKTIENSNWVLFWSGSMDQKDEFISAFLTGEKFLLEVNTSLMGFEKATGKVFYITGKDQYVRKALVSYPDSIGSGCDHAITAMDCGKNAVDAVKMAIKRESTCGGTVRCFDTRTGKFTKVKC